MHPSALLNAKSFFEVYAKTANAGIVLDIGSQNVNGSIKDVCPGHFKYVGVDFVKGAGVDIILDDPYKLPFSDNYADFIVCSSCFEHSEMFWVLFLEIMRVLKPNGLLYLNVPSNGLFHRYPVDCWRFYPDSGQALVAWSKRNGMATCLLESFVSAQFKELWNDYVAIFLKDSSFVDSFSDRIYFHRKDVENVHSFGAKDLVRVSRYPQDWRLRYSILTVAAQLLRLIFLFPLHAYRSMRSLMTGCKDEAR